MLQRNRRTPTPRVRLGTVGEVRVELAKIYRAAKRGEMAWSDATKAAHVLGLIARLIEGSTIERRLSQLEDQLAQERALTLAPRVNGHTLGRN
jgi:hypothetical protein